MRIRGSDVFLKTDLTALLAAMAVTVQAAGRGDEFARGYLAALAAVATALDIPPADVIDVVGGGDYTGRW